MNDGSGTVGDATGSKRKRYEMSQEDFLRTFFILGGFNNRNQF